MICTILNTLPWLLITFTFSESLTLEVNSRITAKCGKPVILHCNISSSLTGLSIKHMEWSQSHTYCSVDSEGFVTSNNKLLEDFHCHFDRGLLSLHFNKWPPYISESFFMCKVRTNQGIKFKFTQIETRDQWERVIPAWDFSSPVCTFRGVCPAGEVQWFQDSKRITDQSLITTDRHVEAGGGLTIHSYLRIQNRGEQYNCTLRSISSGQHLASAVIRPPLFVRSRAAGLGPVWTFLWICVGFVLERDYLLGCA